MGNKHGGKGFSRRSGSQIEKERPELRARPTAPRAPPPRGPPPKGRPVESENEDEDEAAALRIFRARPPVRGKASMKELSSRAFKGSDLKDPFGPMAQVAQNEGWGIQGSIGYHCYGCRVRVLGPRGMSDETPKILKCPKCDKINSSLIAARICPVSPGQSRWFQYSTGDNTCKYIRVLCEEEEEGLRKEVEDLLQLEGGEIEENLQNLDVNVDELTSLYPDKSKEELVQYYIVYRLWDPIDRPEDGYVREQLRSGKIFWSRVGKYRADPSEWSDVNIDATILTEVSAMPLEKRLLWFRNQMDSLRYDDPYEGPLRVFVNRQDLLEDASNWILALQNEEKWRTCRYEFVGEPAMDSGGVAKEWYRLVCDSCFQAAYGLFQEIDLDDVTYSFNPQSGVYNPERHLYYFRFAGRILAKAIFEGCFVEAHLSKVIYKHILGRPCSLDDLKYIDSSVHSSMMSLLEDPESVEALYLDFTASSGSATGTEEIVELKPGGKDIPVTKENLGEYIKLYIRYTMYDRTSVQLNSFLKGFHEILPQPLLSIFNHEEFENIMCGVSQIDIDDWKKNVTYRGDFKEEGEKHGVIEWFWEVLDAYSMEDRSKLLQYITGSSRVPMSGFKGFDNGSSMLISIQSIMTSESVFPRAHTCFNRLELPVYDSKEDLEKRLTEAMQIQNGFNLE